MSDELTFALGGAEEGGSETDSRAVLLDTDVFSYLLRGGPEAERFAPLVTDQHALLSFISVGELLKGAYSRGWGEKKLEALWTQIYRTTVIPFDEALTENYGRLSAEAKNTGHPLFQEAHALDAWIAATAVTQDVPLLTNNRRHFEGVTGLRLVDIETEADGSDGA